MQIDVTADRPSASQQLTTHAHCPRRTTEPGTRSSLLFSPANVPPVTRSPLCAPPSPSFTARSNPSNESRHEPSVVRLRYRFTTWRLRQIHAAIDVHERDSHGNGFQRERLGNVVEGCQQPRVVRLSHKPLDERPVLSDQHVFLNRGKLPILCELLAAVVFFGRVGKHFHDDTWVQQSIEDIILELWLVADDDDVRIRIQARRENFDAQIAGDDTARPVP